MCVEYKSSKSTSNLVEVSSCDFQPQVTAMASIVSARPAKYLAQPTAQKQRPSGVGRCAKKLCATSLMSLLQQSMYNSLALQHSV